MTKYIFLIVMVAFVTTLGAETITASVAARRVGEMVFVEDTIREVITKPSGTLFLNFGDSFPRESLKAIVMAATRARFSGVEKWQGRRVRLSGIVTIYKGHARIILRERGQITLVD